MPYAKPLKINNIFYECTIVRTWVWNVFHNLICSDPWSPGCASIWGGHRTFGNSDSLGAGHEDCTHLIISSSPIHQDVNSPLLENPNTKNSAMPSLHWVSFLPYVFFQKCFVSLIRNETNTTLMPKSPEQQVQDSKVIRYSPWKAQAAVRNIRKTEKSIFLIYISILNKGEGHWRWLSSLRYGLKLFKVWPPP